MAQRVRRPVRLAGSIVAHQVAVVLHDGVGHSRRRVPRVGGSQRLAGVVVEDQVSVGLHDQRELAVGREQPIVGVQLLIGPQPVI
jgi:hypothetical protein